MIVQKRFSIACSVIVIFFFASIHNLRAQQITSRKTVSWHSFEKVEFLLDGIPAWYVKPPKPLAGNPWIWRAHFPNWHITMDSLLLQRGFYVAYINTDNQYGAPKAMMVWDKFYDYLTRKLSFAPKVSLEGVSRGGLYVYGWAKRNPDKVSCIYAEAPVCDVKSWPGGKGKGEGDPHAWQELQQVFGFTEQQAISYTDNPIDHLQGLAAFKVPVMHVINLQDKIVPPDENTFVLVQRYIKLGGPAAVYPMTRGEQKLHGHHFDIEHPDWWANFIYICNYPVQRPLPYHGYFKVRKGVTGFYRKVISHQPVTVAFLGGSITYNPGWRNMICQYLQERFPATRFHFITAGIPSLGSLPDAFRLQRDVLDSGKIDLLFVEAAVNDRVNGTDSLTQIRDLEGIVRHAKRSNPDVDIILMSFADPDKMKDYEAAKIPTEVANHELVAQYYALPSVDLAKEVYDKIHAGEFSWEYDFKSLHPSPLGQEIYFETIKDLLNTCFESAAATRYSPAIHKLRAPLDKYSFDRGSYEAIGNAKLKKGWKLTDHWQPPDHASTRDGFVNIPMLEATMPAAALSLYFTGTAIGIAVVSGPDAGVVEYSIDNQVFRKIDLYTQWSANLHLPWYVLFSGVLKEKKHILRLHIAQDKNLHSKGTACRIAYFLVNK